MKHVDEYRDVALAEGLYASIASLAPRVQRALGRAPVAQAGRPIKLMEVCGGHTHTLFRFGLPGRLPEELELVHGPGCPVCVLPIARVDGAIALAEHPGAVLCSFGDALRVPGSHGSLLEAKARGADVRIVYSPADALAVALAHPEREVIFFALGFETTAPSTAMVLREARAREVANFSVYSNHITIMPTLRALLDGDGAELDGFIGPGHVSMVIGERPYLPIAHEYHKPLVIAGFEPLDVLQAIEMLLQQLLRGEARVENQYKRVVRSAGNLAAQRAMAEVFEARPTFEWRGLGNIAGSGLQLSPAFASFDAERRFSLREHAIPDPPACQCGRVLTGTIQPWDCRVFGTACTPETPIGACMVSSEGACAAYYSYGRLSTLRRGRSA